MRIKCKDTGEVAGSYAEYLTTRHWKDLREVARQNSEGVCACCKRPLGKDFVVHHKTYKRVGRERIRTTPYSGNMFVRLAQKMRGDDVVAVCAHCHNGESKNHKRLHEFVNVPRWARNEKR